MGKPVLGRLVVFLYSFFATLSSFCVQKCQALLHTE